MTMITACFLTGKAHNREKRLQEMDILYLGGTSADCCTYNLAI